MTRASAPVATGAAPARFRFTVTDDNLPFVLAGLALCGLALILPAQADTFYHLRSGQAMWDTGWFLMHEPFSFTAFGKPLANHWWLSQLLFYATLSAGGPALLTALAGGCAVLALFLSWALLRGSFETRVLTSLAYVLVFPQWSVRPQVISMLMLMLTARLMIADRLRWIPVLMLVWANMHALVALGLVLPAAAVVEAILWSRQRLMTRAAVLVAATAAPMVSPLGIHYWPRVLETVTLSRELGVFEYRSAFNTGDAIAVWPAVLAFAWIGLRHRSQLQRLPSGERALAVAAGVLAIAAIVSVRNAAFFVLVGTPVMSWLLPQSKARRAPRPVSKPALLVVAATAVLVTALVVYRWREGGAHVGWRPLRDEAIAAVRACPEPTYNDFGDGGLLMWFVPERQVFVDGRVEAYPRDFLKRVARVSHTGDYARLFSEHRIRCAIVGAQTPTARALQSTPEFHVTYSDERWVVFVR